MDRLTAEQMRRNLAGRDAWVDFSPHREQVMQRIQNAAGADRRLCVLGAGNANDLDLNALSGSFAEVHLVDLDANALEAAAARQAHKGAIALRLHPGVDVTGCWTSLAKWIDCGTPSHADVMACVERAIQGPVSHPLPEPFDVVASTCVLSQLIEGAALALGPNHPDIMELILALRAGHMRWVTRLVRPGGRCIVFIDFVSSDTAPTILHTNPEDLPALAERLLDEGNFFHGLNPRAIRSLFARDRVLSAGTRGMQMSEPWRWQLGNRAYLVCSIDFARV